VKSASDVAAEQYPSFIWRSPGAWFAPVREAIERYKVEHPYIFKE
jgi:hypothetical protein